MTQTIGCGPLSVIEGPPPIRRPYGLLPAAESAVAGVHLIPELDATGTPRWLNGVEMQPYPTDDGHTHQPYEDGSPNNDKADPPDTPQNPQFWPTTVYVTDRCQAIRIPDEAVFTARLREKLAAVESAHVARALLDGTGVPSGAPRLADGQGEFPNNNTATELVLGLALLEGAIAGHNIGGIIHMSPMAATMLSAKGQIFHLDPLNRSNVDVLRTANGTLVIADAGYVTGASPLGHTSAGAGQEWLYASGPIELRRDEPFLNPQTTAQAFDRGMGATRDHPNSITYQAERHYLVAWDNTLQAAVLVNRSTP